MLRGDYCWLLGCPPSSPVSAAIKNEVCPPPLYYTWWMDCWQRSHVCACDALIWCWKARGQLNDVNFMQKYVFKKTQPLVVVAFGVALVKPVLVGKWKVSLHSIFTISGSRKNMGKQVLSLSFSLSLSLSPSCVQGKVISWLGFFCQFYTYK